jgi:hypothetical protein
MITANSMVTFRLIYATLSVAVNPLLLRENLNFNARMNDLAYQTGIQMCQGGLVRKFVGNASQVEFIVTRFVR